MKPITKTSDAAEPEPESGECRYCGSESPGTICRDCYREIEADRREGEED